MSASEVLIVGTSHISEESQEQVARVINERNPEVVCVELDPKRLHGLQSKSTKRPSARYLIRRVGVQGYVFAMIAAWAQKKLADKLGTKPGEDMLGAVNHAKSIGAKVALVDQDIEVTLKRLKLPWRERGRILADLIKGLFGFDSAVTFDISKVPKKSLINVLLEQTKSRYPTIYRVLVTERNEIMARRIASVASHSEGLVVAVLGAGHEDEVARLVKLHLAKLPKLASDELPSKTI